MPKSGLSLPAREKVERGVVLELVRRWKRSKFRRQNEAFAKRFPKNARLMPDDLLGWFFERAMFPEKLALESQSDAQAFARMLGMAMHLYPDEAPAAWQYARRRPTPKRYRAEIIGGAIMSAPKIMAPKEIPDLIKSMGGPSDVRTAEIYEQAAKIRNLGKSRSKKPN